MQGRASRKRKLAVAYRECYDIEPHLLSPQFVDTALLKLQCFPVLIKSIDKTRTLRLRRCKLNIEVAVSELSPVSIGSPSPHLCTTRLGESLILAPHLPFRSR